MRKADQLQHKKRARMSKTTKRCADQHKRSHATDESYDWPLHRTLGLGPGTVLPTRTAPQDGWDSDSGDPVLQDGQGDGVPES